MDAVGFTQKDVANAIDKIWEQTLEKNNFPNSVDSPKAFIWGGGPGAGKSSSMGIVSRKYLNDNALVISGDDFRRYHPNFRNIKKVFGDLWSEKTSTWSAEIFKEVFQRATEHQLNIHIEGTFRNANIPLKTMNDLKTKGYEVNFAVVIASKELSQQSINERYEKQKEQGKTPRAVDAEYLKEFYKTFSENVVKVAKSKEYNLFLVYERKASKAPQKVFSSTLGKELTKEFINQMLNRLLAKLRFPIKLGMTSFRHSVLDTESKNEFCKNSNKSILKQQGIQ